MDMRVFELFKIGVGPSSSHTVGPMLAARRFLLDASDLYKTSKIQIALYGSLALTGHGHATDKAVLLGLMGETPQDIIPESVDEKLAALANSGKMNLLGEYPVKFDIATDLLWHKQEVLPGHPNGMKFMLTRNDGSSFEKIYYSTGGGFIYSAEELANPGADESGNRKPLPYPFATMAELLAHGKRSGLSISSMLRANENVYCSDQELDAGIDKIWAVMKGCISRGLQISGELPGGLHVKRRAAKLWRTANETADVLPHDGMHRVSLYAMAVNEENAAGGRVVTAPTNGAAGIIPAVLRYYAEDCKPSDPEQGIRNFMLAASAIGMLCKKNASISGAEIGCQGEVGVACAMAAAGLTAALGGSNEQVESAAEIGIEHHLGMTCDPIGGLVQIPCIERNGMGAVKAITAASLSLRSDGSHHVSLDDVIETMRQTGADMQAKYKETSLGGLAVHVVSVNYAAC
ncbi:L-serine ammonia-lyase [Undibacterium sp. CY18W]|uniref:L-serine dehydratase n=1 Tax=Undibacterium hunanense TaxID=2762292 RepID=A0ABR6ZJQ2_9BURK|nr:L-serine ammonia-lyase [Undibacterium hunanense]MBC3916135.1 L-serine ammonia-lyase [Undibacterium hunanense]